MLVHQALDRSAEVARHWANSGCPVVIHVDARVSNDDYNQFCSSLSDISHIKFSRRHRCEWGTWSIVQATQSAAEMLLSQFPDVRHAFLASGSCIPLRSIRELEVFLEAHPRSDFIESVTTQDVLWTVGGLDRERFTLRFPFSWKRNRRLFDRYVELQRLVGFTRRVPEDIEPHLGSQWWCLTRQTLSAILEDPERPAIDRYFSKVWIPDESYFQTQARKYATRIESRSLTLSKFDFQGKPHMFYDDHLQLLRRSDCFVARKIWPEADNLYTYFLKSTARAKPRAEPSPGKIDREFSKAVERRTRGRSGLYMQSRFPNEGWENGKTNAQYSVFCGFTDLFEEFETWLVKRTGSRVHGHLFQKEKAHFAGGEEIYNGCLSDIAKLRDYNPKSFLTNLIWSTRGERQCFQFGPRDVQAISEFLSLDHNGQISMITGAWAVPLFLSNRNFSDIRSEAAKCQRNEVEFLSRLRSARTKARVRVWSLADFIEAPMDYLQEILTDLGSDASQKIGEAPKMVDLDGFGQFLQNLRNQGMNPHLVGDFVSAERRNNTAPKSRPYLVQ